MPQPTRGDVHVNRPLTNMSLAWLQDQSSFVARRAFRELAVLKQSDSYFEYDKKQWFRSDARIRAPGTESAGSGYTINSDNTYSARVRAIHKDVSDQIRANADQPIQPDREATEFVTRDLILEQEKRWASTFFTTGVWTGSTTGTDITVAPLWDAANSTPFEDLRAEIRAVQQKTGFKANIAVIAPNVWDVLADHPDALDRVKHTETGIVTTSLFAAALGLEEIMVAEAVEDTAAEGVADSLDFVFKGDVLLAYRPRSPGLMTPAAGYTFVWRGLLGMNASGIRVKRFRMEPLESDRVEGESADDMKLVAAECGAFLNNVIA